MRFFSECTTLQEVKALYKQLAKQHHPDRGGDTATMQQINTEYKLACSRAIHGEKASGSKKYADYTEEDIYEEVLNAELYRQALEKIINIPDLFIELCGTWIWVSGQTKKHRKEIKEAGFFYANKKEMWFYRSPENKTRNRRKMSIEQIRNKYGSKDLTDRKVKFGLSEDQD